MCKGSWNQSPLDTQRQPCLLKRNENTCPYINSMFTQKLHTCYQQLYSSSSKLGNNLTAQHLWMNSQTVAHPYRGILLIHATTRVNPMHYQTLNSTLYHFIYSKKANLWQQTLHQDCQKVRMVGMIDHEGTDNDFLGREPICILIAMVSSRPHMFVQTHGVLC